MGPCASLWRRPMTERLFPDDALTVRAIIEPDQVAVFINKGEVIGTLGPGQHKLDADEIAPDYAIIGFKSE